RDEAANYLFGMAITFTLGFAFVLFQFLGWHELNQQGIRMNSIPTGSYLYMISGLHAVHFIVGVIILGISFVKAIIRYFDPVKQLMFTTDSEKQLNVKLTAIYWHFVDLLWVVLYVMFVVLLMF